MPGHTQEFYTPPLCVFTAGWREDTEEWWKWAFKIGWFSLAWIPSHLAPAGKPGKDLQATCKTERKETLATSLCVAAEA